jgi:hypothetical protein
MAARAVRLMLAAGLNLRAALAAVSLAAPLDVGLVASTALVLAVHPVLLSRVVVILQRECHRARNLPGIAHSRKSRKRRAPERLLHNLGTRQLGLKPQFPFPEGGIPWIERNADGKRIRQPRRRAAVVREKGPKRSEARASAGGSRASESRAAPISHRARPRRRKRKSKRKSKSKARRGSFGPGPGDLLSGALFGFRGSKLPV